MNGICWSTRKVNIGQNSEIPILYFCASMKLYTQPATYAKCLKIVDLS